VGLALVIVLLLPSFATVLGIMGSACAFTISVAFPCWCYSVLFWDQLSWVERIFNKVLSIGGLICAILGTYAAVMQHAGHKSNS